MFADGKFRREAKIGYELMFIFLATRLELSVLDGYTLLTPSAGINLIGAGSLLLGYNIGLNNSLHSGICLSVNLNFGDLGN